ncbi:hypothetical protein C8F01DRAFT_1109072 [Mycena amicta]|nr:hypothetical protein C8F01DRAFT_1109072 [Mycena amicta]
MNSTLFAPFRVFIDPGCEGRPKTIRALKAAGADIVSDPKVSDFLLVQGNTGTGQWFIREYGPERVVLECAWVATCISAGRLLKEPDNWGGCRAIPDPSIPIDEDDLDEPSTLPTPRITPVEPASWPPRQLSSNNHLAQQPALLSSNNFQQQQFTGVRTDPNDIYGMVLADIMQSGLVPYPSAPSGGAFVPQFAPVGSQPPGLLPHGHGSSTSTSISRSSSVDLKGKGRASVGATSSESGIFTSEKGKPLTFYVALEVPKRSNVISEIKRNGGQMSHQVVADFAVLSFRSRDFSNLLESVISSNGTAVKVAFVLDSVEEERLLDPTRYAFDVPEKLQKKLLKTSTSRSAPTAPSGSKSISGRKPSTMAVKPAPVKAEPVKESTTKKKSVKVETKSTTVNTAPAAASEPDVSNRPRSPPPPPSSTRVLLSAGKYRYTPEETEYAIQYATYLFERDRLTSYTTLAKKLHEKMPHHTEGAWSTRLSQNLRSDIDDVKKRALIAFRKREHQEGSRAEPTTAKRPRLSDPASSTHASTSTSSTDLVEREIQIVAKFFADGADREEPVGNETQAEKDARVWGQLTQRVRSTTEESWEIFYNKNHTRIMQAYSTIIEGEEE